MSEERRDLKKRRRAVEKNPEPSFMEILAESLAEGITQVFTTTANKLADDYIARRNQVSPREQPHVVEENPENVVEGEYRYVEDTQEKKNE